MKDPQTKYCQLIVKYCLLPISMLVSMASFSLAVPYTSSPQITTEGNSLNWGAQFTMSISISGTTATYQIRKTSGEAFSSSGTMYLKAGTHESYGADHDSKPVTADSTTSITFIENLSDFPATTYPKQIYARYETEDKLHWSWVGPITITREMPPSNETTYKVDTSATTNGESLWGSGLFRLQASIDGSDATFMVTKNVTGDENPTFSSSGTMTLQVDTYESTGGNFLQEDVFKNYTSSALFYPNLDYYSAESYPREFYARYETGDEGWGWVGPITISRIGTATGSITSPGSSAEGNLTVSCTASDPAGIQKLSVVFVPNGNPLVMCEDGTANPCSTMSGLWNETDINPLDYGISEPGSFVLGLWMRNGNGESSLIDKQIVNWSTSTLTNSPPTGSLQAPVGLVTGPVTLRATATDSDGLKKVSAVFVAGGNPLVLCDDDSVRPCNGTTGSWDVAGINPTAYGVTAGNIVLGLHVQDDASGNTETLAATTEFTWIPADNQFPTSSRFFNVCVGHNYEQQMPLPDTEMPTVSLTAPATAKSGETVLLQANGSVDTANDGAAFYYYCTRQGALLYDNAQPDQVSWIAPLVPGFNEPVKLYVQIGDGLGYIDSEVKTVNVTGSLTRVISSTTGLIYPGETLRKTIPLSDYVNRLVAFVVKWPGSDIDLLPMLPDGAAIDYTHDKVFGYYEGKTKEYYIVYNEQSGSWNIDLKAIDVAAEGEPYEFIVYTDDGSLNGVDSDSDGIPDAWEYQHFANLSHDASTDADKDGLNDLQEYLHGTDPNNPDTDNDGMPDGWEVDNNLDPLVDDSGLDPDHDGFSNLEEFLAGTDPQDASSRPVKCDYTVPDDFTTIQDAINYTAIAAFGSNVCVRPGTYVEPRLRLLDGVYLVARSNDPAETIIDGNGKDNVITTQGVRVGGVIGFTLRNSKGNGNAAGIKVAGGTQMALIAKNIIEDSLHGIWLQGDVMPVIINNTIVHNSGDGISAGGNSPATILNNIVAFNQGQGIVRNSIAIYELARNDVYGNDDGNYVNIDAGQGGLTLDPRFADGYRLVPDSPCNSSGRALDGSVVDMGAYGGNTAAIVNTTASAMFVDVDQDGIDDNWEIMYFGNLTTANSTSDYDGDGYSDLQEYLNNMNGTIDPKSVSFDLTGANVPDGEGYVPPRNPNAFLSIIIQFLLDNDEKQVEPAEQIIQ